MTKYISILRGINVGGNRKILMLDLAVLFTELGFLEVETYIQSGNVIFESVKTVSVTGLEKYIQEAISLTFGFDVPVIIKTTGEWAELIANNPFLKEENMDIDRLHLTCLKKVPSPELMENIKQFQFLPDRYEIIGKNVFIYCENGYGRTKITNDFFEKKLKVQTTTRNWKTVMKLHEMAAKN